MSKLFIIAFFCLLFGMLSSCNKEEVQVKEAIEYDQFGNEVIYTEDGEKELINDDCD